MKWLVDARRRREERRRRVYAQHEITDSDVARLAQYNTEKWRGIVHDPEFASEMADVQSRFDAASKSWMTGS